MLFFQGKCLGCGHTPSEHAGYVADPADLEAAAKKAAAEAASKAEREERRRKLQEEEDALDKKDAERRGKQIQDAADSIVDFLTPKVSKVMRMKCRVSFFLF